MKCKHAEWPTLVEIVIETVLSSNTIGKIENGEIIGQSRCWATILTIARDQAARSETIERAKEMATSFEIAKTSARTDLTLLTLLNNHSSYHKSDHRT